MEKHHGQLVEFRIRRCGYKISTLASELKINRRSLYNFFRRKNLNRNQIMQIGIRIGHDFSKDLPELFDSNNFNLAGKSIAPVPDTNHLSEDSRSCNWKDKYIELLEQHHALLTNIVRK